MTVRTFHLPVIAPPAFDWVPGAGQIRTLSGSYGGAVQTMQAAAATINGTKQDLRYGLAAWCGMTYARTLGAAGSLVLYVGGHGDYPYNEVYRFDVSTRSWSQLSNPLGIAAVGGSHSVTLYTDGSGYYIDPVYGEYYGPGSTASIRTGQVSADHTYGKSLWLPQGSIGSDAAGYYFNPSVTAGVPVGSRVSTWPHFMPLSSPVWQRGGSALPGMTGYGCALYDSLRNRAVSFNGGDFNRRLDYWNCATQAASSANTTGEYIFAYYATAGYDSASDLYMVAINKSDTSGYRITLINPTTLQVKFATLSGADRPSSSAVGGWEWVQEWGAWVHHPGSGSKVYLVKKPADPWNGTWTVTSQTLTGDAPSTAFLSNPHHSRFRYIAPAGCFLWHASSELAVQAWNVTAP